MAGGHRITNPGFDPEIFPFFLSSTSPFHWALTQGSFPVFSKPFALDPLGGPSPDYRSLGTLTLFYLPKGPGAYVEYVTCTDDDLDRPSTQTVTLTGPGIPKPPRRHRPGERYEWFLPDPHEPPPVPEPSRDGPYGWPYAGGR